MFEAIEQAIVSRLQSKLGQGVGVHTEHDIARVPELRQRAPAVFVIYDGYSVVEDGANGRVAQIEQQWLVVCAALRATGRGDPIDARNDAGAIAGDVLAALLGYHLGGGRYIHIADAPGPEYEGGFCYLPLAFTIRATFRGTE